MQDVSDMRELSRVALYADLACPYAYVAAYRLRKLSNEYRGRLVIEHKSLPLEYVNRQPTPKPVLDSECPLLMVTETAFCDRRPGRRHLSARRCPDPGRIAQRVAGLSRIAPSLAA